MFKKNVILLFTRGYTSNVGVTTPAQIPYMELECWKEKRSEHIY